jgi:hypothetical protein
MKKLQYDPSNKRYFFEDRDGAQYLFKNDFISFMIDDKEVCGNISYSNLVIRNYYIPINQGKNFIALSTIKEIL